MFHGHGCATHFRDVLGLVLVGCRKSIWNYSIPDVCFVGTRPIPLHGYRALWCDLRVCGFVHLCSFFWIVCCVTINEICFKRKNLSVRSLFTWFIWNFVCYLYEVWLTLIVDREFYKNYNLLSGLIFSFISVSQRFIKTFCYRNVM